ncbi:MAG: MBL fold metallo-hydrolase [Rubrivivax sp.]|nr:MBL fold metallo-hydrolase [Rubrivivax sp.]MBP6464766.1 MBL fold metallo-hydrolase [Rubrivivax sp.]
MSVRTLFALAPRSQRFACIVGGAWLLALVGCSRAPESPAAGAGGGGLSPEAHQALLKAHDWSDPTAMADAARGLIAAPKGQVRAADGSVVWDFDAFAFVKGPAPVTAHPGLWRQALLNNHAGLFKVSEGIWQLRGFDLANMTLIQGKTGWIVVDPLTTRETAAYALAFARQHLGAQPVSAVVFTHSHVDHFGGALGVVSAEEAAARKLPIVAPAGFMEEATSENIMAGGAMGRRAIYQFGRDLPRDAQGLIDGGLGKTTSFGQVGILPPTVSIAQPRQEQLVDGVRFVFHNVPGSEAPSEFTFALPDLKAYCGAELLTHTLHNVMTPRGAKVRDALRWSQYMGEALQHVQGAEVFFASHHWPVWGPERIHGFVTAQRDVMKYLHDQTVRLFNAGLNAEEIADQLRLPPALDAHLHTHGYYGALRHNVRGVYQFYLSSFDGNPATMDGLPRAEVGKRLVALAGGADKAVAAAQAAFDQGDLRWTAQLLDGVLRAEPAHEAARALLVRTYRQLGFAAEASTWRNFYLSGAHELQAGPPQKGVSRALLLDMLRHVPTERFLEAMAASLNGPKAEGLKLTVNLVFSDTGEVYVLRLDRSVLWPAKAEQPAPDANATLTLTKPFFLRMMSGEAGAKDLLLSSETKISGSTLDLGRFFGLLDKAPGTFAIVPAKP